MGFYTFGAYTLAVYTLGGCTLGVQSSGHRFWIRSCTHWGSTLWALGATHATAWKHKQASESTTTRAKAQTTRKARSPEARKHNQENINNSIRLQLFELLIWRTTMTCICTYFHVAPGSTSDVFCRFPGEKPGAWFYIGFIAFVFPEKYNDIKTNNDTCNNRNTDNHNNGEKVMDNGVGLVAVDADFLRRRRRRRRIRRRSRRRRRRKTERRRSRRCNKYHLHKRRENEKHVRKHIKL